MKAPRPPGPPLPARLGQDDLPPAGAPPLPVLMAFIAGVAAFMALRSLFLSLGLSGLGAVAAAEWLGLALLPLLLLTARGIPVAGLFRLPSRKAALAGVVLALAGLPVAELVGWLQSPWIQADPAVLESLREGLVAPGGPELVTVLLAAAVTPAICEEISFRGLLLSAASPAGAGLALGVSSLAFGAIHWVPGGGFRVLPAAVLGLLGGWIAWRTASLLPAVLFHLCHNGGILVAASVGSASGRGVVSGAIPGAGVPDPFSLTLAVTSILFALQLTRST